MHYQEAEFEAPWHFHPQLELNYINTSVGTKFIGDCVDSYHPGELVILGSNLPHCWKNQIQDGVEAGSTFVQWDPGIFSRAPELAQVFHMLRDAGRGIIFKSETIVDLIPLIHSLPEREEADLYLSLLQLLNILSTRDYSNLSEALFQDDLPREYESRITKVQDFVQRNFARKIYLREIAALVNMSEQAFSRFFSKMMGRPFFTFINEYRINVASRMLLDTDWSVGEIAFRCGFESNPFFYKQFKKFKQQSPLQYRKTHDRKTLVNGLR